MHRLARGLSITLSSILSHQERGYLSLPWLEGVGGRGHEGTAGGCLKTSPAPDRVGTKSRNTPILWAGVGENSPRDIEMTAEVGRSGVDILVLRQPPCCGPTTAYGACRGAEVGYAFAQPTLRTDGSALATPWNPSFQKEGLREFGGQGG